MSTRKFFSTAFLIVGAIAFTACGDNGTTTEGTGTATEQQGQHGAGTHQHDDADMVYQCPMKCEGERVYETPGKCPVCKMDLKPVAETVHEH